MSKSKEIDEGSDDYFAKLRKKRMKSDPSVLIWMLSGLIAVILVIIGFLDFEKQPWSVSGRLY